MAERVMAKATPALLRWARETRGFTLEQAAESLSLDKDLLSQAERGEAQLTFAKLRQAAEAYKRPLAIFYLPRAPRSASGIPDFRRLPDAIGQPYSPNLLLMLRRIAYKRSVAIKLSEYAHAREWGYVESVGLGEDPETVGSRIRSLLELPFEKTSRWREEYARLVGWRTAIEQAGVLVFVVQRISLADMRGMSIAESPFPVIALNRGDSPAGRLFSLLHEFTHILLGQSAVCDDYQDDDALGGADVRRVEIFCNAVAAAALMPRETVRDMVARSGHVRNHRWEEGELRSIADTIGVSAESFLRRLVGLSLATRQEYEGLRQIWQSRPAPEANAGAEEGGDFGEYGYQVVMRTQGQSYVRMVLDAMHGEAITAADASDFLDMKLKHLADLEGHMVGG